MGMDGTRMDRDGDGVGWDGMGPPHGPQDPSRWGAVVWLCPSLSSCRGALCPAWLGGEMQPHPPPPPTPPRFLLDPQLL